MLSIPTSWPQCVYRRNPAQKVKFPTCFGMCWTTGPRISPNYKHAPINPIHKHTWDPSPPPPSTGLADPPPPQEQSPPPQRCHDHLIYAPTAQQWVFHYSRSSRPPLFCFMRPQFVSHALEATHFLQPPPPFHPPRSEAKPCKHSSVIYFIG